MTHSHADNAQANSPVTIYTTPTCGYCRAAKQLLDDKGVLYTHVDLTQKPAAVREALIARTGHRTVPMVFVGEHFVGGYTELATINASGEFDVLYEKERSSKQT